MAQDLGSRRLKLDRPTLKVSWALDIVLADLFDHSFKHGGLAIAHNRDCRGPEPELFGEWQVATSRSLRRSDPAGSTLHVGDAALLGYGRIG